MKRARDQRKKEWRNVFVRVAAHRVLREIQEMQPGASLGEIVADALKEYRAKLVERLRRDWKG